MTDLTYTLYDVLRATVTRGASDLHLTANQPPIVRVNGHLRPLNEFAVLSGDMLNALILPNLDADREQRLHVQRNLDISVRLDDGSRFRGNLLWQRETLGAVFRRIPPRPSTIEELGLPEVLYDLVTRPRGLILVTGPTGSGKSTTQAAMIDHLNQTADVHVVTVEDPIEYVHTDRRALIRQRELGSDVLSFAEALRFVLRQDPDVILVGEMRDLETMSLAVTAAETGHLVISTLHTTSCAAAVDRIIDSFPAGQQNQIRLQLASTLEAVLCQTLIPRAGGGGRVCAMEVMLGTPAVRNLIRESKAHQLTSVIEAGAKQGMQSLNMALRDLVRAGRITMQDAVERSSNPESFERLMGFNAPALR